MRVLAMVLALGLTTGTAQAASLTFDGTICNGGGSCTKRDKIDQTYGDIAGKIDVKYDADRNDADLDNLFLWDTGYESLTNIAYGVDGGGGLSIVLEAASGFDVMLNGFDIAPYNNRSRSTLVQIIDLATNTVLENDVYDPLTTSGVTSYSDGWFSTVGLQINLGPDAWDVGIDNVDFTALGEQGVPQVPLPASGLLLIGGLAVLGRMRRKA